MNEFSRLHQQKPAGNRKPDRKIKQHRLNSLYLQRMCNLTIDEYLYRHF